MCLAITQACIKENFPTSPNDVTEGEEVTLSMSVSVPGMEVATRALDEYDQYGYSHPTLWVVVFDQQGYFVQAAKATSQEFEEEDGYPYNTNFKVKLTTSPEQRILHFLLNYTGAETETLDLPKGHESTVIGTLTADSDNQDVYWQRVVLPYGIVPPQKNDTKNPDYTNYVEPYVTKVPLIRNFAKVTVTESLDNFTIEGFSVMNRPNRGTVAPYADGRFVNYLQTVPENGSLYDVLTNGIKYHGTTPEVEGFEYYKTTLTDSDFVDGDKAIYLYESTYKGVVEETPTVIIKGIYEGVTAYYKADLVVQSIVPGQEKYADILRNFEYNLIITSVAGPGKTLDEAVKGAANNNLSGSVQIQELTNITNGEDGLYVSATDITIVEKKDLVIRYKFVQNITSETPTIANGNVSIYVEDGAVIAVDPTTNEYSVTPASNNASDGWREVTVKLNDIPSTTETQKIIFYDNRDNGSKLRREVIIRYRPKIHMDVECVPESVASVPGTPVVVNIKIPQELNKALFPLEFAIEANTTAANNTSLKQYISPAKSENTSVRTGETIVTEKNTDGTLKYAGAKSYQYIKKLSYEEYETLAVSGTQVVLPVYFVTNTAASASKVYVSNMYFEDANDTFGNFDADYTFTNLEFDGGVPLGSDQDVKLKFNMNSALYNTPVTITLIGLKRADGTTQFTLTPDDADVELNLKTTQESGNVAVLLAAENYVGAMLSAVQSNDVIITAGKISFSNLNLWNDTRTIYVYSDSNYSNQITSFTLSSDPGTNPDLNLGEVSDSQRIYFRYQVSWFGSTTNYTASATVAELQAGCTLEFE